MTLESVVSGGFCENGVWPPFLKMCEVPYTHTLIYTYKCVCPCVSPYKLRLFNKLRKIDSYSYPLPGRSHRGKDSKLDLNWIPFSPYVKLFTQEATFDTIFFLSAYICTYVCMCVYVHICWSAHVCTCTVVHHICFRTKSVFYI